MCVGVSNLRTIQTATDATTAVWDPPDTLNCGPVLYYTVSITNMAISCDINIFNLTVPRAEFSNLIKDVTYTITVTAANRAGVGMKTTINVTTLAATVTSSESSQGLLLYITQLLLNHHNYNCMWFTCQGTVCQSEIWNPIVYHAVFNLIIHFFHSYYFVGKQCCGPTTTVKLFQHSYSIHWIGDEELNC